MHQGECGTKIVAEVGCSRKAEHTQRGEHMRRVVVELGASGQARGQLLAHDYARQHSL